MMAVVGTGGRQYRVVEGSILRVAKLPIGVGGTFVFDDVLMFGEVNSGYAYNAVGKAVVKACVLLHAKDDKIVVFKKKRRKGYKRKSGHRQDYTLIRVDSIKCSG